MIVWMGAYPAAVLQPGEYPLWFQLTKEGPLLLESIEDAVYSEALVPWPLALHIRFLHDRGDEIIIAVNRDGFMKFAPNNGMVSDIKMYHFPAGSYWRQYTVGGLVFKNNEPAALLYLDNRFLDTAYSLPLRRTWSFNMNSNVPYPIDIPALQYFPAEDGWDADTLRLGIDGMIYYRVANRRSSRPEIRMFRTANLSQAGEEISIDVFQNSVPRRVQIFHPSLPPLPEGFVYTWIGYIGNNLFAAWEEQEDFNIGAAGFMVIRH
jgi:hypothetical protein